MAAMRDGFAENDSHESAGGSIPDAPGVSAFRVWHSEPSTLPVLIAVPHAGRAYPRSLLHGMRHPEVAPLKLEDRYVDKLASVVARETGAALLLAQAPRAMIDLNRAPDDLDWEMFHSSKRGNARSGSLTRRARSGLGLIPRRLPGVGEIWRQRQDEAVVAARIAEIHEPYHAKLGALLQETRDRWGAALLIDLHSMPPLSPKGSQAPPEYVIGDRFGASCHGSLVSGVFAYLAQCGLRAAHNRPYAGGYVLERHADPAEGIHALQVEIDRSCYLDSRLAEPGPGFSAVADVLTGLTRRLSALVGELAECSHRRGAEDGWPLAAE